MLGDDWLFIMLPFDAIAKRTKRKKGLDRIMGAKLLVILV
jgi:hypothetical protein